LAYEGSPTEQAEAFFADIAAGKSNDAVDRLYASNPAMQQKLQTIALVKQQLSTIQTLFGSQIGTDTVRMEQITDSITRIVIVAKHELHPVIWELYFYRPQDKWIVSQALFNDQFQLLGAKK